MEVLTSWEGIPVEELLRDWGVDRLEAHGWIDSTNDRARTLLEESGDRREILVVLAEGQTGGRGRQGRTWHSSFGRGLWLTVAAPVPAGGLPPVTPLRIGLVVAEAIESCLGHGYVEIKWPNDLLIGGRKVGGILCENVPSRGGIVGVGINILQAADEFPAEIRETATSLAQCSGSRVSRSGLAGEIVRGIRAVASSWRGRLESSELGRISTRDALLDRLVSTSGGIEGEGRGITPEGTLLIQDSLGRVHSISSGTVRRLDPRA